MAHGTPESLDEMPEYLTRVRGGRPPSPEVLAEVTAAYAAIGGRSPLTAITLAQGEALQALLDPRVRVLVGMRNWRPYIADVLSRYDCESGFVLGIPLTPQFSTLSVQKYIEAARAALPAAVRFDCVSSFHDHPLLLEAFAERVRDAAPSGDEHVIFTAHSLPVRVAAAGDPYPAQFAATAEGVAQLAGVRYYSIAYQSAGRVPEPWLGPDVREVIRRRAAAGTRQFLVVPIGFVCDHTEILFDIDIQASGVARESGATLRRTESLNTSPTFIRMLASLVEAASIASPTEDPNPQPLR